MKKYNKLTVICESQKKGFVTCKCDCGEIKEIRKYDLIYGKTKSCGCLRRETVKNLNKNKKTHGERYTRLYRIWIGMKSRCFNKNNHAYSHYGQREIVVCDEWKNDYLCFKNWARETGINKNTIWARLFRYGWSVEKALSTDYKFFNTEEGARKYLEGVENGF